MDHGIELPDVRERNGKDPVGTIRLKAYYAGTNVILEVQDDGAGIDKQRVWQKALQLGLARAADRLSDHEIYDFIFHPGFSTARQITDISGRGVGMDVVKRAIVNLRGEIEIESVPGRGTTIRLKLPLSLSIIDGLLVDIAKAKYIIPLSTIDKCYAVDRDAVCPDMNDLIVLDGEQVPYVDLRSIFRCQGEKPEHVNLIVAKQDERKVAFAVDRILDEYQAVIKPLGKIYKDQDFASGATILGNGAVALVLDTNRLMEL
jgi:two-component system chemotaxis sensor kinase CheA